MIRWVFVVLVLCATGCSDNEAAPPSSSAPSTTAAFDVCADISADELSPFLPGVRVAGPFDRTEATDPPPLGDCKYDLPDGDYLWVRVVMPDSTVIDDITKENGYGTLVDGPQVGQKVFFMRVDTHIVSHARGTRVAVELDGPFDPATAAAVHELIFDHYDR